MAVAMAFLDYVNEICNEIYDVIVTNVNKLYQGAGTSSTSSPHREISIRPAQQWQNYQKKLQRKLRMISFHFFTFVVVSFDIRLRNSI